MKALPIEALTELEIKQRHLKTYRAMLQRRLLLMMLVLPGIVVQAQVAQEDSLALVALYQATDGANWSDHTNWLTGPVAQWFGVGVAGDRVNHLDLNANGLTGQIPVEIGDLTGLTTLKLGSNRGLTGQIPVEVGNLTSLTELNLWFSDLTGQIPTELSHLTHLTYLNLWNNGLTGQIPAALSHLTHLTFLNLDQNDLTGEIPAALGMLPSLTFLSLSHNDLTGEVPAELGNLSTLHKLSFRDNRLIGTLPLSLTNLSMLDTFFFDDTRLCVPSEEAFRAWLLAIPLLTVPEEICIPTALETPTELPSAYTLQPNYPNPFNPQTTIRYGLPQATTLRLVVFDAMGRRVRVLVDDRPSPGWHEVVFDASHLPSGVYFYRLEAGSFQATGKMLLVK